MLAGKRSPELRPVVLVARIDVDPVRPVVLGEPQRPPTVGAGQRVARQAAPERAGGDRGRGVADRWPVEADAVGEPVVDVGLARRHVVDGGAELRVVLRRQTRVTAVAVVVEVAGVAGGAAAIEEIAQMVVGVVAALAAEHPGRGRGADREAGLEPAGRRVPGGVAGADRRRTVDERSWHRRGRRGQGGRPESEGLEPLPGSGVGGDRREQRVVDERGDAAVAEVDRDLEPVECLARRAGEQEKRGTRGLQRPDRGVRRDQPVEDRPGAVGIAGFEAELGLPRGRDDRRHSEEVPRRRGHGGRCQLGRAGQGGRIAAGRSGPQDEGGGQ